MININCTSYKSSGKCLHQAAPRKLLGPASCIVWLWNASINHDPRQLPTKCALCTPVERPQLPPKKPAGPPNELIIPQAGTRLFVGR